MDVVVPEDAGLHPGGPEGRGLLDQAEEEQRSGQALPREAPQQRRRHRGQGQLAAADERQTRRREQRPQKVTRRGERAATFSTI